MYLASLIFVLISTIFFIGLLIIAMEKNRLELIRLKRWRYKIEAIDLKKILILKPYYEFLKRRDKEKYEIEIWESVSFMRNAINNNEEEIPSDALLEEFIKRKGPMAHIFSGTLQLIRQNQTEEAKQFFIDTVGTKNAKEFGHLLAKWDNIDGEHLKETLITHQKNIRETRFTNLKRRDEMMSNLVYLPVVINIMLILLNFIYVGYFKDQMEMLTLII